VIWLWRIAGFVEFSYFSSEIRVRELGSKVTTERLSWELSFSKVRRIGSYCVSLLTSFRFSFSSSSRDFAFVVAPLFWFISV